MYRREESSWMQTIENSKEGFSWMRMHSHVLADLANLRKSIGEQAKAAEGNLGFKDSSVGERRIPPAATRKLTTSRTG